MLLSWRAMESLSFSSADKAARYDELLPALDALFEGEPDLIANLANATAALKECIGAASWVGFYLWRGDQLVLGPFQGKVACVRIALGKGVCGTAAMERRTVVVPDVEQFPGHIACDAGSRSEIVVPLLAGDRLLGVLDVDSYDLASFDGVDALALQKVAARIAALAW
jgi:L-methionine (R)-S-oxide reductase